MKYIFFLISAIISCSSFGDNFDCSELAGTWRMDGYDNKLASQRESYAIYDTNGEFMVGSTQFSDSGEVYDHVESGVWECADGILVTFTDTVNGTSTENTQFYEIEALNNSYLRIRQARINCEGQITDCPKTYELYKQ